MRIRRPSFSQGIVYLSVGTAVNIALLFVETMVAVRVLDTEIYGIYVLLIVIVSFLVIAVDFGCKTASTQLIASNNSDQQSMYANNVLTFRILILVLTSVLVLGSSTGKPFFTPGLLWPVSVNQASRRINIFRLANMATGASIVNFSFGNNFLAIA